MLNLPSSDVQQDNYRVLMIGRFIGALFFSSFIALWQPLMLDIGASMVMIGFLASLTDLSGLFASPVIGYVSDRAGRKPVIVASSMMRLLAMLFLIASLLNGRIEWLYGYALLMGSSVTFKRWNPAMASLIAESAGEKLGAAYSLLIFINRGVSIVSTPIGGLLALRYGYMPIVLGCVLGEAARVVLYQLSLSETLRVEGEYSLKGFFLGLLKIERMRRFYLAVMADGFVWGVGFFLLYGMLKDTYKYSPLEISLFSTVMSLSWAVSQVPAGKLIDTIGFKRALMLSESFGIVALIFWLHPLSKLMIAAGYAFAGVMSALWVPTLVSYIASHTLPEQRSFEVGRLNMLRQLSAFIAPTVGGIIYTSYGYSMPLIVNLAGACLCITLLSTLSD